MLGSSTQGSCTGRTENMFQMKEQDKTPEEEVNEVEIGNLHKKEFRVVIIKMIKEIRGRMDP